MVAIIYSTQSSLARRLPSGAQILIEKWSCYPTLPCLMLWEHCSSSVNEINHSFNFVEPVTMYNWPIKENSSMCDPLVTHRPYLSTLEIGHYKALYNVIFTFIFIQCVHTKYSPHLKTTGSMLLTWLTF